jgi:TRAP-type mannitol/chloroaromatic compound transport system permease small subunit
MRFHGALYSRSIDTFNRRVGRFAMYLIFALMGVLFWSSVTKYRGIAGAVDA